MIKELWRKFPNNQFGKFVFVGLLNTVIGYFSFAFFIVLGLHYNVAITYSSIIGIIHSYFWNKYFTFQTQKKCIFEIMRFVSVYGVVYIVNLFFLWLFVNEWHINELISQAFILVILTIISFIGHKFWSFNIEK